VAERKILTPVLDTICEQVEGLRIGNLPRPDLPLRPSLLQLTRMFEDVRNAAEEQIRGGR